MAATSLPSAAANGTRRRCTKGATTWRKTCAFSRRRTPLFSEHEGVMALKVYALTCGHLEGELGHLMEGGEGRIRLPIPSYLIEHPKGTALFDTGMHPDCQDDPAARLGARIAGLFAFDYRPGEEIGARLAALGRDPAKIDLVVNSHFHFDHGDGSVVCLPTHGHTPGHQSLKLRLAGGDIVLAADSCYFCQTLRERRLPRFMHDRDEMLASLDRLAVLEAAGARIFFG